jgi:hypothetical protein
MKNSIERINQFIQCVLQIKEQDSVSAVEAAIWLDAVELLKDSQSRKGLPLRNLLRAKMIKGQRQESNRRWYIDRLGAI